MRLTILCLMTYPQWTTYLACVALAVMPVAIFAEVPTPSIGYTGAPTDHGGQNCSTCHTGFPVNDPSGSLQVTVSDYVPSVQQVIKIVVQNPERGHVGLPAHYSGAKR